MGYNSNQFYSNPLTMRNQRIIPEVNAGSMADIAFLLLIFFLVTASIENDTGFNRMLPPEKVDGVIDIKARNLFEVSINPQNDLMVNGDIITLSNLRERVIAFIDNGGIPKGYPGFCAYCQGKGASTSSDNPNKAIISLKTSRNSDYSFYIAVQNEIIGAYHLLRNREGKKLFGESYVAMVAHYNKSETTSLEKIGLKKKIDTLRGRFPQKFVEPEAIIPN